jgi:hypothetical protein
MAGEKEARTRCVVLALLMVVALRKRVLVGKKYRLVGTYKKRVHVRVRVWFCLGLIGKKAGGRKRGARARREAGGGCAKKARVTTPA